MKVGTFAIIAVGSAFCAAVFAISGCGASRALAPVIPSNPNAVRPESRGKGTWQSFTDVGYLAGIVQAGNGDFWVANGDMTTTLSRFTRKGKLTVFQIGHTVIEMTIGSDGNFWLTGAGHDANKIIRVTPDVKVTSFTLNDYAAGGITLGGDGNVWFVENAHIGMLTPGGSLTEYPVSQIQGESGLTWADGLVWFRQTSALASLDPQSGAVKRYSVPMRDGGGAIVHAGDGSLWYVLGSSTGVTLVSFQPSTAKVNTYAGPGNFDPYGAPANMTLATDGSLWYTAQRLGGNPRRVIGGGFVRFDSRTKRFKTYAAPKGYDWMWDLVVAPDGRVWGTAGGAVAVLDPQ